MAAEKGRAFLLKWSDGTSPISYTTVAGLRTTGMTINNERVDVTSKDDDGWLTALAEAGNTGITISASGVFKDSANEATIRAAAIAGTLEEFEIYYESGDTLAGSWHIDSFEHAGDDGKEVTYSITLSSSGEVEVTTA